MRVAICIGCNSYQFIGNLASAETDATRIFHVLTNPDIGKYDPLHSRLLLSPTLAQVRSALDDLLYSSKIKIVDVTIFFAGHGGVFLDTFYLALADTDVSKIALTGLSFADLAKIVVAAQPLQANFVLDACHSGGLGFDLHSILTQSLTGTAQNTGFSALAAAAANEAAFENSNGGVFTGNLLAILQGSEIVQRSKPYLDLAEIGSVIRVSEGRADQQTVSVWVLNLQGPNRFCLNQHYEGSPSRYPDHAAESLGKRLNIGSANISALKRIALEIPDEVDAMKIAGLIERVTSELPLGSVPDFLGGLAEGFAEAARNSSDPFAEQRVLSLIAGQLVRIVNVVPSAQIYIAQITRRILEVDRAALRLVLEKLDQHEFGLLSREGLPELFYLPPRISALLGQIGALSVATEDEAELEFLERLTTLLLKIYGNSVLTVSEEQAAPLAVFLSAAHLRGWQDIHEEVICRLFADLVANHGLVAHHDLGGQDALAVLRRRYQPLRNPDRRLFQQPSDLATVIVAFAALTGLDDVVDSQMILVDHLALNFFEPQDVHQLGETGPLEGINRGYAIGNGIWTCADFRREWRDGLGEKFLSPSKENFYATLWSALALEDRVPWFVVASSIALPEPKNFVFKVV
ncbi:caspase family protein [Mesorhizobium erdmanii]|uniref:caspase family protein n=1 Tax=Mesorhizobium erdmanii TaxID=1777866 RepID=UPI00040C675B|nr:caspase family protein [Mesorhizobium erdmanii]